MLPGLALMNRYAFPALRYAFPALAAASSLLFAGPAVADETTLAAGAGFRRPLAELATDFSARSGHKVLQVYGHVGQVIAQARESREITVVCGDKPTFAKAEGISFSTWVPLGQGRLVIAYRRGHELTKAGDLSGDHFRRIGIPDQVNAIYGRAGRQFLQRAGLAGAIDPRLVPVATVPQVTGYVSSGEVDAGFVNATDAIGAGTSIGGYVEVDQSLYDPVEVACGVRAGVSSPALDAFTAYLGTEPARAILERYGL